jgi:hypothetical protein
LRFRVSRGTRQITQRESLAVLVCVQELQTQVSPPDFAGVRMGGAGEMVPGSGAAASGLSLPAAGLAGGAAAAAAAPNMTPTSAGALAAGFGFGFGFGLETMHIEHSCASSALSVSQHRHFHPPVLAPAPAPAAGVGKAGTVNPSDTGAAEEDVLVEVDDDDAEEAPKAGKEKPPGSFEGAAREAGRVKPEARGAAGDGAGPGEEGVAAGAPKESDGFEADELAVVAVSRPNVGSEKPVEAEVVAGAAEEAGDAAEPKVGGRENPLAEGVAVEAAGALPKLKVRPVKADAGGGCVSVRSVRGIARTRKLRTD